MCSDIIFALVKSANTEGEIESVYSFIWKVTRNVYANYSEKRRQRKERLYEGDSEELFRSIADEEESDESRERIEEFDTNVMHSDPSAMTGGLAYAQMRGMRDAANNSAGSINGFMGFGMAANAMGGAQSQSTLIDNAKKLSEEKAAAAKATNVCPNCKTEFDGKFCPECGTKAVAPDAWICPACGKSCTGKFCAECGASRPQGYVCDCGYKSDKPYKFCPECGKPSK